MSIKLTDRLKIARRNSKLRQEDFAKKLKIATPTLSNYETGKRVPDANLLALISKISKCSPGWLLTGEDTYEKNPSTYSKEEKEYTQKLIKVMENPETKKAIKENLNILLKVPTKN